MREHAKKELPEWCVFLVDNEYQYLSHHAEDLSYIYNGIIIWSIQRNAHSLDLRREGVCNQSSVRRVTRMWLVGLSSSMWIRRCLGCQEHTLQPVLTTALQQIDTSTRTAKRLFKTLISTSPSFLWTRAVSSSLETGSLPSFTRASLSATPFQTKRLTLRLHIWHLRMSSECNL